MLQRDGKIVAAPIPDVTIYTVEGIINENVAEGSTISTDKHRGLQRPKASLQSRCGQSSAKEYVRGIHHVNSLESHWSLFKRAIKGTHVHISQSTLGNTSASSAIAAICGTRIGRCSIFLFRLSRCRAYKRIEILSVSGVCVGGRRARSAAGRRGIL